MQGRRTPDGRSPPRDLRASTVPPDRRTASVSDTASGAVRDGQDRSGPELTLMAESLAANPCRCSTQPARRGTNSAERELLDGGHDAVDMRRHKAVVVRVRNRAHTQVLP